MKKSFFYLTVIGLLTVYLMISEYGQTAEISCLDLPVIFNEAAMSLCIESEEDFVGELAIQSSYGSTYTDVTTSTPFISYIRFFAVTEQNTPSQFSPGHLSEAQNVDEILSEIERQYVESGITKIDTPKITFNNSWHTGIAFKNTSTSYTDFSEESLYSYWAIPADEGFTIIELEEPIENNMSTHDMIQNYENISLETNQLNAVYLPTVLKSTNSSSPDELANNLNGESEHSASLPLPSWWTGVCNNGEHTNSYSRYEYNGLHVCMPNNTSKLVHFFNGAHGQLEWQCVELVMRYMYLAHGVAPYKANGKDVFNNYSGQELDKIRNNTVGEYPKEGDVISFGGGTYGHTAIVIDSAIDDSGNGYYKTLNQNWDSRSPIATYTISNWNAQAIGWLRASKEITPPMGQDPIWWGKSNRSFDNSRLNVVGTYKPISGDFNGDGNEDIFWYRAGNQHDPVWFGRDDRTFYSVRMNVQGDYTPISGDFDGDGYDDIFWYRPGEEHDPVWFGRSDRKFDSIQMHVDGTYTPPISGDFDGDGRDDIFWYRPGEEHDPVWFGRSDRKFDSIHMNVSGTYTPPISGDFDGDGRDDIFWYRPGEEHDPVWFGRSDRKFDSVQMNVNGTYTPPISGDFDGDGHDDIFWYRPGEEHDPVWFGRSDRKFDSIHMNVNGTYPPPISGDFDGDGYDDVFWYRPGD